MSHKAWYAKIDIWETDPETDELVLSFPQGTWLGVAAGGGACEEYFGDELIDFIHNDPTAHERYGVLEDFHYPVQKLPPPQRRVDLSKVGDYEAAVEDKRNHIKTRDALVRTVSLTVLGTRIRNPKFLIECLEDSALLDKNLNVRPQILAIQQCCDDCDNCEINCCIARDNCVVEE